MTWAAARQLARQLKAVESRLGGVTWNSVRCPEGGPVYLLYDPPNGPGLWNTAVSTIDLDTPSGMAAVRHAVHEVGWTWLDTRQVDSEHE